MKQQPQRKVVPIEGKEAESIQKEMEQIQVKSQLLVAQTNTILAEYKLKMIALRDKLKELEGK